MSRTDDAGCGNTEGYLTSVLCSEGLVSLLLVFSHQDQDAKIDTHAHPRLVHFFTGTCFNFVRVYCAEMNVHTCEFE